MMVGTEGYDIAIHCPVILKCNEKLNKYSISNSKLSRIKYCISLHNYDNLTKKDYIQQYLQVQTPYGKIFVFLIMDLNEIVPKLSSQ